MKQVTNTQTRWFPRLALRIELPHLEGDACASCRLYVPLMPLFGLEGEASEWCAECIASRQEREWGERHE